MKKMIPFVAFIIISCSHMQAQDQPYSFIKTESTDYSKYSSDLFTLTNSDTSSPIKKLTFDTKNSRVYCLDTHDVIVDVYEFKPGEMAIWLSVDPLLDKKPGVSPFVYCLNNPLRYIDPDGRDEWEVSKQGQIMNHIKTSKHDAFYMVGDDGKRMDGESISFKYGTVNGSYAHKGVGNEPMDIYSISGAQNSEKLFEFFANNTHVEWGNTKLNGGVSILSTSHEGGAERASSLLRKTLHTLSVQINGHDHNHPGNTIEPSPGDRVFSRNLEKTNPFSTTRVYTKQSGRYHTYDKNGYIGIMPNIFGR